MFNDLHVDKENANVFYNDEEHVYWTKKTNKKCVSATTLINMFTTFDREFWGRYKALEALVSSEQFMTVKKRLLDTKKFKDEYLKELDVSEESFKIKLEEIYEEWRIENKKSTDRGTAIHKIYEDKILGNDYSELKSFNVPTFEKHILKTDNLIQEGYYTVPELLISWSSQDDVLNIAGQADLVIITGNKFQIMDYKTNKKIEQKSFFDRNKRSSQKMLYPLNNLDDVNFWHYTLQMSLYAWMIRRNNPNLELDGLYLLHHDHADNKTVYECEYLEKEVERMLKYYKKKLLHKEFKKSREKIIF